jgi:ribonuclease HI
MQRLKQVEKNPSRSCRWIAGLLGKITAVIPAVAEALLHIRHIQRDLARSLQINHHQWDKSCTLSQRSLAEIQWWKTHLHLKNGLPIHPVQLSKNALTVLVDASDSGWGVHSTKINQAGFWNEVEREESINGRELKAIYYALRLHAKEGDIKEISLHTDNITALKYVTKAGGTASESLQNLAVQIQDLCNEFSIKVQYQHIAGIRNTQADQLSRLHRPLYEATIPKQFFKMVKNQWGSRWKIDAFAAVHNHQLPQYWSLTKDPLSLEINAFHQSWRRNDLYMFPQWKLIPRVLRKIEADKTRDVTLITPFWTSQFWFPMLLRMNQLATPIIWETSQWNLIG